MPKGKGTYGNKVGRPPKKKKKSKKKYQENTMAGPIIDTMNDPMSDETIRKPRKKLAKPKPVKTKADMMAANVAGTIKNMGGGYQLGNSYD